MVARARIAETAAAARRPWAWAVGVVATTPWLLAASEKTQRLDPERRAKAVMALLALVLVAGAIVSLAVLWGRHVRRIATKRHPPTQSHADAWYRKPLVPTDPSLPREKRSPPAEGEE